MPSTLSLHTVQQLIHDITMPFINQFINIASHGIIMSLFQSLNYLFISNNLIPQNSESQQNKNLSQTNYFKMFPSEVPVNQTVLTAVHELCNTQHKN